MRKNSDSTFTFSAAEGAVLAILAAVLLSLTAVKAAQRFRQAAPLETGEVSDDRFQHRIDINSAPEDELALVPGIGEVRAQKIVEHRSIHGGFAVIDDLAAIEGFSRSLIDRLRPYLQISQAANSPGRPPVVREVLP